MENDIINEELWRLVPSLNNKYEVSSHGQIRNAKTKHILHQYINRHGYCILQVNPTPNKSKNIRVHQIVTVNGILIGKTWKDVVELYNKEKENTK